MAWAEPQPALAQWRAVANITASEARILELLYSAPGRGVTRGALLDALYFDRIGEHPAPKILDVHVAKIRRKLRGTRFQIETLKGVGYRGVVLEGDLPDLPPSVSRPRPAKAAWRGIMFGPVCHRVVTTLEQNMSQWMTCKDLGCSLHAIYRVRDEVNAKSETHEAEIVRRRIMLTLRYARQD